MHMDCNRICSIASIHIKNAKNRLRRPWTGGQADRVYWNNSFLCILMYIAARSNNSQRVTATGNNYIFISDAKRKIGITKIAFFYNIHKLVMCLQSK